MNARDNIDAALDRLSTETAMCASPTHRDLVNTQVNRIRSEWGDVTESATDADNTKLVKIQVWVDRHFTPDPYHAGRVAHQMNVDSAVNTMYRIREVLEGKERF